jgi:hypothetical protein
MQVHTTIKIIPIVLAALALSLILPGGSRAALVPDRVVFPTGEWPTDVENVQAAVDLGGIVLLKANNAAGQPTAFNFGVVEEDVCGRQVALQGDVALVGESVGAARTTIVGGYRPILVGVSRWGACGGDYSPLSGHVRIEGITFEGPDQSAIDVYKAASAEIIGNRISNVIVDLGLGVGLNVFGGGAQRRITGRVSIADNIIRFPVVDDVGSNFAHAIVLDNVPADVEILRNFIENTQDFTGILVVRQVEGTVRIADNFVAPHPQAPGAGNGVGIYIYADDRWDAIRTSAPVYELVGNRVVTEGYGIGLLGQRGAIDAPVVERNHISTTNSFPWAEGIFFGGNISTARVSNNRIDGSGAFGIDIFAFEPGQLAESNTFVGNNVTQFEASIADVFLDVITQDTVVVGEPGTVVDLGTGNQITGMSRIGQGEHIGLQIRIPL